MSLRKGLIIFIILAFGASGIIIAKSVTPETIHSLLGANKKMLLAALALVFLSWLCDAGRFCALTLAAKEHVTMKMGLVLTWLNYFGSAVTPMQSGGGPFQVYVLYKRGIPIGKGIAITMIRTMLTVFILSLVVPFALCFEPAIMKNSPFLKALICYVFVVIGCTWLFILFTILRPNALKRLGKIMVIWMKKIRVLKSGSRVKGCFQWLDREVDNYILNFKLIVDSGKTYFFIAIILSVLHLLCIFTVLPVLMSAVHLPYSYIQALTIQAVFMFVLYFIPTPGASGVAESGGALLFVNLMPPHMAGIMAIIWRFFTEYISIFMGVAAVIKMLGWGVTEELHKGAAPDNEAEIAEHKCS